MNELSFDIIRIQSCYENVFVTIFEFRMVSLYLEASYFSSINRIMEYHHLMIFLGLGMQYVDDSFVVCSLLDLIILIFSLNLVSSGHLTCSMLSLSASSRKF